MEVYAGFLAQTDYEVGRLLGNIKAAGHYQDTVVFYIVGDNGASGEGGLDGHDEYVDGKPAPIKQRLKNAADLGGERFFNHYSAAWAWATNTPFQWTKQVASHLGGTRDPLIVSWPGHIKDAGAIRTQFHHVTDIAPTIYELTGVKFPAVVNGVKQLPLEGESLAYTFDHRDEPSPHKIQYFEMLGNRGIYQDGWWAGSRHLLPWEIDLEKWLKRDPNQNPWELYNLTDDFSQAHDLAEQNPEKLKELVKLFDSEARRNNVYPLVPNFSLPPEPSPGTKVFVYQEGVQRIPAAVAPSFGGRAHRITAQLELPPGGAEGVILALGGHYGGFSLYLKDGRLAYEVNYMGDRAGIVSSPDPLPPGKLTIEIAFTPAPLKGRPLPPFPGLFLGPGVARLSINGRPAGEASIKGDPGFNQYDETLDIGSDLGTPVSAEYASPFRFTGHIEKVTVELL
jgi:arylsulfatase